MSEMRGGGGSGGGGVVVVDPSNLHLKKELTQIRKAARALRDPGTTSSWRSPLSSARSTAVADVAAVAATANHYYHHYYSNSSKLDLEGPRGKVTARQEADCSNKSNNGSSGGGRRDRKVFLYNWRTHKSESEQSASLGNAGRSGGGGGAGPCDGDGDGDCDESVDNSLSDARNNGNGGGGESKSDTYIADRYASLMFNDCKGTNLTPIRRTSMRKKVKKGGFGSQSAVVLKQHLQQLQRQSSLVDQSDDTTEDYVDLRRGNADSPLLSRLRSSKLLRGGSKKEESSYCYSTPALSTSSTNRYRVGNPSTVGSWDGTTTVSFNYGDDEVDDDQLGVPGRQGCGIPCYWSKRTTLKRRGGVCASCYSPSLSDTLRRKGSSMLCGSQTMYRRRRRGSSLGSNKKRLVSRTAQGLVPLLTSSADGRGGSSVGTDDELSTNFGELDLEALSRLDGRRWSSCCRSQEGLELVAVHGEKEEESLPENITSLSQKYKPMFFEELVGQNIVVQSLMNAVQRGRISPIYLFQGPRGTGKTSAARIFASALNCLASEETKPCGVCKECTDFISGKSRALIEVDGSNKKGIDRAKSVLKNLLMGSKSEFPLYKVLVVDECQLLPSKSWLAFLKFLEQPQTRVVFIFITTDLDNVPRTVLSQCQKYLFSKIKDADIVTRLRKIAADEDLDVESDALELISLNADGSLRDAETMLDQLSLLGKRITPSLVNELVGVVSDEKLLELLEFAMSSDTAETVKRARELLDSGVDPMVLMSQLATLIMDIIAGTYQVHVETRDSDSFIDGRSLAEAELERLKHALKLLSEAEKQLRVSSERSTWFTATLLQLGSVPSPDPTQSGSSRRQSSRTTEDEPSCTSRDIYSQKQRLDALYASRKSTSHTYMSKGTSRNPTGQEHPLDIKEGNLPSRLTTGDSVEGSHDGFNVENTISRGIKSDVLDEIWVRCIDKCHSKTLRQLLHYYGKLVSISEVEGVIVAYIAFDNRDIKARAERFLSSITNSFEIVLRHNVEVRIILLPDNGTSPVSSKPALANSLVQKKIGTTEVDNYSDVDSLQEPLKISKGSFNDSEGKLLKTIKSSAGSPLVSREAKMNDSKVRKPVIPVQRIESIIHEQRLETAWLQTADKGTPGSLNRLKPERNQVLPQDGIYHQNQVESINALNLKSQQWEDDLNRELNLLKINDVKVLEKDPMGNRVDNFPMSPSLLHDSSYVGKLSKESMGYESGSGAGGCGAIFCWNNPRHHRRGKKAKQGTPVRSHKGARCLWFGECAKTRRMENRQRR